MKNSGFSVNFNWNGEFKSLFVWQKVGAAWSWSNAGFAGDLEGKTGYGREGAVKTILFISELSR